jgi:hypothetical protein
MRAVVLAVIVAAAPAHADITPVRAPMTAAAYDVCDLLKSDRHDSCKRLAHLGGATVYQAGSTHGIRRFVLALDRDDDVLVSPALDVAAQDATLDSATPTVRTIEIDGRPAIMLDVIAKFHRGARRALTRWQTETIVGCGETAGGAFACSTVDVGNCDATVAADGGVATSCGGHTQLSLL